ncbi:hypothetical protein [Sinomicrobium sp. M5D2P9]
MKISYRNQTVLKMLHTGTLGPVAINSQDKNELTDELLAEFGKLWKIKAASFNKNVKVLSLPFAEAVNCFLLSVSRFKVSEHKQE